MFKFYLWMMKIFDIRILYNSIRFIFMVRKAHRMPRVLFRISSIIHVDLSIFNSLNSYSTFLNQLQ